MEVVEARGLYPHYKAGVPIQTIQKVLGHSDIKVTARHYRRLNTREQRLAMEQNLVFENLPRPDAEPSFTFHSTLKQIREERRPRPAGFPCEVAAF